MNLSGAGRIGTGAEPIVIEIDLRERDDDLLAFGSFTEVQRAFADSLGAAEGDLSRVLVIDDTRDLDVHSVGVDRIVNAPGVIDSGYRGEVKVCLVNLDPERDVVLAAGDRIAQLVVVPFIAPVLQEVADLEETDRAQGGFGSSGGFGAATMSAAATTATTADETTEG